MKIEKWKKVEETKRPSFHKKVEKSFEFPTFFSKLVDIRNFLKRRGYRRTMMSD